MSIVLCVPQVRLHKNFIPHIMEFYAVNKARHGLRLNYALYRPLYEVQAEAVLAAQASKASHILFVEDDHWGFPADGLDELLDLDLDVVGFQTVRKSPPFRSLAMKKKDPSVSLLERIPNLLPHDKGDGPDVQETDVLTWAFTLVKTSVFDRLHEAGKFPFNQVGPVPGDSFFNQYCEDIGIKRHVHFGYTIAHGEHSPEDLDILREAYGKIERRKRQRRFLQPDEVEMPSEEAIEKMMADFHKRRAA